MQKQIEKIELIYILITSNKEMIMTIYQFSALSLAHPPDYVTKSAEMSFLCQQFAQWIDH